MEGFGAAYAMQISLVKLGNVSCVDIEKTGRKGLLAMPFNHKKEWINPDDSYKERDEYIGYSECVCGKGVHLYQAGFDADMFFCGECDCDVADRDDFFKYEAGRE